VGYGELGNVVSGMGNRDFTAPIGARRFGDLLQQGKISKVVR
jgi:hypothetical protein